MIPASDARPAGPTFLSIFRQVSFFQLINSASAFLVNILVARLIGPRAFGNFFFYVSTAIVTTVLFDFGLSRTLLRYSAFHQSRGEIREKLCYYSAVLRLKTLLGLALLAAGVAAAWVWGRELRWELSLGLLTGFIVSYSQFLSAVAQTEEDYSAYNLVLSFSTLRLCLIGLLAAGGLVQLGNIYITFVVAPLLLAAIPGWRLGRDLAQAGGVPERHFFRNLILFGRWMVLLAVLETVYQRLDVLLVRGLTNAEQAGYYSGALAFFGIVYMLPTFSAVLVYPKFVKAIGQGDREALRYFYRHSTDLMAFIAIPLALGLWSVTPELVHNVLGAKYLASAPLFKYMAVYSLILGAHLNSGGLFFAHDRPQWVVLITLAALLTNLSANLWLIPRLGIAGAGIAICLAVGVSLLLSWGLIRRQFGLLPDLRHLGGYLLFGGLMAAGVRLLPGGGWGALALKVACGASVYALCLLGAERWLGRGWIPRSLASLERT